MRIILNGSPIMGRLTGVGQYAFQLLLGLLKLRQQQDPNLEQLSVFTGTTLIPAEIFIAQMARNPGVARWGRLKQTIRKIFPQCRDLADLVRHFRLRHSLGQTQWDLFHETNFVSPSPNLPLVTTVHDMSYLRFPQFMPRDRAWWLRRHMGRTFRNSKVILTDSYFTRDELLNLCPGVDSQRVRVAQLGVDWDYFSNPIHDLRIEELKARWNLPERFVLYLGTLEPRKNLQGLLAAYELLPERLQKEFPLVLAGVSGWKQDYFQARMERLASRKVLHNVGYIPSEDVPVLLRSAEVFCFPSLYEGFGLPALEAAAAGTPVLCSNTASLPEVMGTAAVYVNPQNHEEIAAELEYLLENEELRQSLSIAGRERAKEFCWTDCVKRTLTAYQAAA